MEMNVTGHYQHAARERESGKFFSPSFHVVGVYDVVDVSTPLILQCVGRVEACYSEGKLIISLCALQFLHCFCEERKNGVIDAHVMACLRFHNNTEIKLSRVTRKTDLYTK